MCVEDILYEKLVTIALGRMEKPSRRGKSTTIHEVDVQNDMVFLLSYMQKYRAVIALSVGRR